MKFLPGEIVGTITAVGSASITHAFNNNGVLVAYAGSLGEAIGFYVTILIQHILSYKKKYSLDFRHFKPKDFTKITANLLLEFGPAGMIDGLLLRPLFMFVFPILIGNFTLGLFIGKLVGDITFYLLVIITTEVKEKVQRHKKTNI